jgi:hypothetical protein
MNLLKTLDEKLLRDFDLIYLQSVKEKLPHLNAYYVVCLCEVLSGFIDAERTFANDAVLWDELLDNATGLYNSVDISRTLRECSSVEYSGDL